MPLVTLKELLSDAQRDGYAVGLFNAWNMLSACNVAETAEKLRSPVMIAVWQAELDFVGEKELYDVCLSFARKCSMPVAIFIDHATDIAAIKRAIEFGATSVMIDGSSLPLEENIAITREAVEIAHAAGVSCEGEIGTLGEEDGSGDVENLYTDVAEAEQFAAATGVDALAVAIGNAHGFYRREPKLDFERLGQIAEVVNVPLVLHGGTGIGDADVQRAIGMGIAKVNIGSEGRKAFIDGVREGMAVDETEVFYHKVFPMANVRHRELLEKKMKMMGSNGRA